MSKTSIFGVLLEVLHQKRGYDPNFNFFLELELVKLDVFSYEFFRVSKMELIFLERSATFRRTTTDSVPQLANGFLSLLSLQGYLGPFLRRTENPV